MKKAHFILIVTSILAGILLNTGCNPTNIHDVRGTWIVSGKYNGDVFDKTLTFREDITQGKVTDELNGIATYTSNGYNVNFDLSIICFCEKNWKGCFVDKDYMEGTLNGCSSCTWTASRI
jgi:hypothetical protein